MSAVCLATTTAKLTRPADYSPRSVLLPQLQQPTCCQRDDDFLSKLFQLLAMHKRALDIKLIMANREKPFTDHPFLSLSLSSLSPSLHCLLFTPPTGKLTTPQQPRKQKIKHFSSIFIFVWNEMFLIRLQKCGNENL